MPISEAEPDGIPARCLPELLGEQGYRSTYFQSATERFEDRPELVENMGFEFFTPLEKMEHEEYELANYFGKEDAVMLSPSEEWLQEYGDEPFMATYLTLTPHHVYLAPRRYGRFQWAEDDVFNRYLNSLYYVDQFSRELLEQYRDLELFEDTLFVFVGDHGEAFGEHGRMQHDNVIWEEGIHIPLFIYDPSNPEGRRTTAPVSQIDVAPTIVDALGFDVRGGRYPGVKIDQAPPERRVYAHCWYELRCMASIGERWKYIDHFAHRPPEVYDLLEDPLETENLADEMADEISDWERDVRRWRAGVNAMYRGD